MISKKMVKFSSKEYEPCIVYFICMLIYPVTVTDRSTHIGRHPGASDAGASLHRDRLRGHQDGPEARLPVENRHLDHRVARDKDWGKGDFDVAERRHRHKPNPDKHVRLNSRPVNKHEPR